MSRSARQRERRKNRSQSARIGDDPALSGAVKIGKAAELVGVQPYVLRFWETQFPSLKPIHVRSKHRLYRPQDIELLRTIKRLLYAERFTIAGARRRLREMSEDKSAERAKPEQVEATSGSVPSEPASGRRDQADLRQILHGIKADLESLRAFLNH